MKRKQAFICIQIYYITGCVYEGKVSTCPKETGNKPSIQKSPVREILLSVFSSIAINNAMYFEMNTDKTETDARIYKFQINVWPGTAVLFLVPVKSRKDSSAKVQGKHN